MHGEKQSKDIRHFLDRLAAGFNLNPEADGSLLNLVYRPANQRPARTDGQMPFLSDANLPHEGADCETGRYV